MVPLLTVERGFIGVGGLLVLLLIEAVRPFRPPVDARWRRYAINFFITGSNALILSVLLGGLLVSAYQGLELGRFGLLHRVGIASWWNVAATVIFLDAVTYWWHRAYHGVPVMWRMHRVHHSEIPAHTNSNYSTIFSWWDRLFGTYRVVTEQRTLTIGLPEYQRPEDVTAGRVLAMPFGPPCGVGEPAERPQFTVSPASAVTTISAEPLRDRVTALYGGSPSPKR